MPRPVFRRFLAPSQTITKNPTSVSRGSTYPTVSACLVQKVVSDQVSELTLQRNKSPSPHHCSPAPLLRKFNGALFFSGHITLRSHSSPSSCFLPLWHSCANSYRTVRSLFVCNSSCLKAALEKPTRPVPSQLSLVCIKEGGAPHILEPRSHVPR